MEGTKRNPLGARKKVNKKKRSIVAYLKSDSYLFAPLFSDFPPSNSESSNAEDVSIAGFDALGMEKRRRMSEKMKEYLNSDYHMYAPTITPPKKLDSSLKGKLKIPNLVTMEVSTSTTTTTMREDNNCRNLQSGIAEHALHNGRIHSPRRARVSLEGQRTRLSHETDLSPVFSSLPEEKMVKPDQRRVTSE